MRRLHAATLPSLLMVGMLVSTVPAWAATASSVVEDTIQITVRSPDGAIDDLRGSWILLLIRNLGQDDLLVTAVTPIQGVTESDLQYDHTLSPRTTPARTVPTRRTRPE